MIFVTGGTGMLGSYLILELLNKGHKVRAVKRASSNMKTTEQVFRSFSKEPEIQLLQIEWVEVDLFCHTQIEENLIGITEIYHCAAQISTSGQDNQMLIDNNQLITENMVNAALAQKIAKFCYVSSISALGNTSNGELINETTLWKEHKTNSTYSISKYKSEMEVWRGIAEGLNAVIVNPSVILGVGDWTKGSASLFGKIKKGMKYYTHGSSGFVNAQDVISIMILLMADQKYFNQAYIVSSENLDFKTLFKSLAQHLKVDPPNRYANPFLTQVAWRLEWIRSKVFRFEALITKESARTAHKTLSYDNSKLLDVLPFEYQLIDRSIQEIGDIYSKE